MALSFKVAVRALNTTADLLEVLGADSFRAQAYRTAARSLEAQSAAQADWDALVAAQFKGVPKVGAALAGALSEAHQTGTFGPLQEALQELPPGLLELLEVRGLGPKKVRALWLAGIDSLEALRESLESGAVAQIKGFGAKTAQTLTGAVAFALSAQSLQRLDTALGLSEELARMLSNFDPVISGAAVRGLETVERAEVVVTGSPEQVALSLPWPVTTQGHTLEGEHEGLKFAIHTVSPEQRGAAEVWYASPESYRKQLGDILNTKAATQAQFWQISGQTERPAEYRESQHDSIWQQLPAPSELITQADILGYIHTHSTYSDGADSLHDMAQAAQQRSEGCYLGIADHSQAAHYARGLTPERLRAQIREVAELRRAGLNILAGSEVDILEDGTLDFDDDLLSELDYVVASVHTHLTLSAAAQTERLIRAVSHPLVTVLGHPTGRVLLRRASYELDMQAVLEACAERGTVVELNSSAQRLDLDWRLILPWRERLKFALNTDAHSVAGLGAIRYGVMSARKAGLRPKDIINTLTQSELVDFVAQQRRGRSS